MNTSGRRGFTLVEVLIALLILAVGILGIAAAQLFASRNNAFAIAHSRALGLVEERLELLRSAPTCGSNELADGTATDVACERRVSVQGTGRTYGLAVDCQYTPQCAGGAACPPNNYIQFTVRVTTPGVTNAVALSGGKDIQCP